MALALGFLEIVLALTCFLVLSYYASKYNKDELAINWPLVGMVPDFFCNIFRMYDRFTELLEISGLTFLHKGPWFTNTDMLVTVDPANVHHVMSENFDNYPKGPKFKKIFEMLGDGILNSDEEPWRELRKLARTVMNHDDFMQFSKKTSHDKLHNVLIPILDDLCERGEVVDLQDLLQRYTFDTTSILVCGYDPKSLSGDFLDVPYAKAMNEAEEAVVFRHILPEWMWKLVKWLDVGWEKKLRESCETIDRTIADYLSKKRREMKDGGGQDQGRFDMLSWYMGLGINEDKFLRDTIFTFMTGGRDTTSVALTWFFWLLSKNPDAKRKIIQESLVHGHNNNKLHVYLHGALCETLRLYPPVAFEQKTAVKPDILPSGHRLKPGSAILFPLYSMGRMKSIWGEDCLEFKPERWISERGTIKHQPSYKFLAFNAGPRTCLGKEVAFMTMKMVAAALVPKYDFEVVEGHPVKPCLSIVLHMTHGFKVKVTKRCDASS